MDREWELKALCRSQDPEIWFSKKTLSQAKKICTDECPVREECLEAILARESLTADSLRSGIVAGLTGQQRAKLAAAQRSEKPAKPKKAPGTGRPLAPCGTRSAYHRHVRKQEPIDDECRAANSRAAVEYRATGSVKVPAGH